ncbi:hypothetical protein J19TS2_40200 [Cohnella xylanilytica]|nr:hypothetical protein J19TS2_40200 [Cohnella xylanilytica]
MGRGHSSAIGWTKNGFLTVRGEEIRRTDGGRGVNRQAGGVLGSSRCAYLGGAIGVGGDWRVQIGRLRNRRDVIFAKKAILAELTDDVQLFVYQDLEP